MSLSCYPLKCDLEIRLSNFFHSCITLYTPVFLTCDAPGTKMSVAFSTVSSIMLMLKEQFTSVPNDISGSSQATCRLVLSMTLSILQPVMVTFLSGPGGIAEDKERKEVLTGIIIEYTISSVPFH